MSFENFADLCKVLALWTLFKRNLQVPPGAVDKMFKITYSFIRAYLVYFFYCKFLPVNINLSVESVFVFTKNDWRNKDEPFLTNNSPMNALVCWMFWIIASLLCWIYFLFFMYIYSIMIIINSCDYIGMNGFKSFFYKVIEIAVNIIWLHVAAILDLKSQRRIFYTILNYHFDDEDDQYAIEPDEALSPRE